MRKIEIDIRKMVELPIDDKNVMSDWLLDTLFDNEEYTFDKNESVGFIAGYPSYVEYFDNCARIRFLKKPLDIVAHDTWANSILEKLSCQDCKEHTFITSLDVTRVQYLDDSENEQESQHILTFIFYDDTVTILFHWNVPKN